MTYKEPNLAAAAIGLIRSINHSFEIGRKALPACVLNHEGTVSPLIADDELRQTQKDDGGWNNVRDTALLATLCHLRRSLQDCYQSAISWLTEVRKYNGGWGLTERDTSRIPVTGLLLHLLPELSDSKAVSWLTDEWRKDLESDTKLTYKGGFFLLGLSASKVPVNECLLIEETYRYLFEEQNEDGGFGPWKGHPIGSDPWSTGIVLLSLLSYPKLVKREVIEKTVNWLAETQLHNGLWPCHYIEEGSAYAYWGLVEALKFLFSTTFP